ncbi:hypothetical protein IX318_000050 [Porphyromonas levii]|nr:hypothetical protein [Porphyromonas levii]MBR8714215.1 hypothetical protein [Porphyromonas levii]MBR8726757.1 hypothetical protein [Porphyromonas levii]MBR8735062.1 hypothetical protein [Porphyromonas levii]MBR8758971.1 hypothetical protein [Porphyromonas levii]
MESRFFMMRRRGDTLEVSAECTEQEFCNMLLNFLLSDAGRSYSTALKEMEKSIAPETNN